MYKYVQYTSKYGNRKVQRHGQPDKVCMYVCMYCICTYNNPYIHTYILCIVLGTCVNAKAPAGGGVPKLALPYHQEPCVCNDTFM